MAHREQAAPRRTRRPFRRDAVMDRIRGLIAGGVFAPGDRLPTRQEIAAQCSAPPLTVQDAFDRLVEQGHVEVRGRDGTFVARHPPHRHRFVIALHGRPGSGEWNELWARIDAVARRLAREGGPERRIDIRYDVRHGGEGVAALAAEIAERRVAGIFFGSPPFELVGTPLLDAPGPLRAAIGSSVPGAGDRVMPVHLDSRDVLTRMVAELARLDAVRPAWLIPPPLHERHGAWLGETLRRRRLADDAHLMHLVGSTARRVVPGLLRLLLRLPARERPDSLVVGDDNLLPEVLRTLGELGVRPGEGFQVVAHANFPVAATPPGVRRIGFSIPQAVGRALAWMEGRIAGQAVDLAPIPAYRDDEVDALGVPFVG